MSKKSNNTNNIKREIATRAYANERTILGKKKVQVSFMDQFVLRATKLKSEKHLLAKASNLRKVFTGLDLVLLGLGGIVGAGVFVLTGMAARNYAGPAVVLSYLIALLASLITALSYSEFATCIPTSGSAYNFISITFGELFAYITGWNLVIELTVGGAAVARGFTSYFATLVGLKPPDLRIRVIEGVIELDFLALLLVTLVSILIIGGVEQTKKFQYIALSVCLSAIFFVLAVGSTEVKIENYTPFVPPEFGWKGVMSAASVVFFAFIGFDTVATMAEETIEPCRNLPIGILGSLAISGFLYCSMAAVITGMVPYDEINIDAPFSTVFYTTGHDWAAVAVSSGAVFCIVTSCLACLLSQPRVYLAMARDGLLPGIIAELHPTLGTPVYASLLTWALTGLLTLLFDINILAQMVSIGTLAIFCGVNLALLVRRYTPKEVSFDDFDTRVPVLMRAVYLLMSCFILSYSLHYGLALWIKITSGIALVLCTYSFYALGEFLNAPTEKQFKTPLVPLIPILGVLATSQLIVCLGSLALIRFSLVSLASLVSYLCIDYVRCCGPHLNEEIDGEKNIKD